jgi:hypothetical protein
MAGTSRDREQPPGKPGRKPHPANQGERVSLGLKVTPEIKNRLDAATADTGRTQSQEAEWRLDRSFQQQHLLDQVFDLSYRDPQLVALLLQLGEAMRDTITSTTGSIRNPAWVDNPWAFEQVARAATFIIEAHRPEGEIQPPNATVLPYLGERIARGVLAGVTAYNDRPPYEDASPSPVREIRAARARTSPSILARLRKRDQGPTATIVGVPEPDPEAPIWTRQRRVSSKAETNQ